MSRHFSFDFDDPCPGAAIEALLGIRGGRLLEEHAGVAIAILENRPIALRLEGPRAGAYATLTKTGLGRPQTLSDRLFLEMVEAEMGKSSGHATRQVVGLAEGEARLRHVMAEIQEEIQPAISALLALESRGGPETGLDRTSGPVTWSRTECFGALAAFFDMGGYPAPGLCLAEISAQLLEEFHIGTYDLDADEVREAGPFPAYQILATPGLGKTRSVLSLIEALPLEAVVWVFQPTLKKGHEFARDMAGSSRPVHLFRGRGAPFEDGATEHMCRRSEAAANLAAKGYPVKKTLCEATEPGQPASCPHASGCAYLAQLATLKNHQGGGVFVLSHASLTQPPPCPAPHLVVIDEDPSASLTLAVKVGAQALGMASGWATHLPDESEETKLPRQDKESDFRDSSQDDEQPEAVADLFERLVDGLNSPAPLQAVAESITVAEFEAGMKMLRRLERKLATGLTSGLPGSLGVETAAISADHFHLGMSFQPVGAGDHITIFENIDDRATLQIDNDRAVGLRLPPAPVVDPDDGRRLGSVLSTVLQLPKHRVITDPKAQAVQEPLGRPPAGRVPKMADNFPDTRSAPRKRTRNRADLVRESPARAGGCQTSPTANPEGYRNPVTMGGIILQPPTPPAVTTSRLQSTVWADAVWCQTAGYSPPAGIAPLNALNGNIAPGRPVLP